MKRDLLILTPDFPPRAGGIQTLVYQLASSFERYRPHVITLGMGNERGFDQIQPFRIDRVRTRAGFRKAAIAALNVRGIEHALRRRPTAVLSAHIVTGPAAIAVRRLLGVPAVQYVHAYELNRRPTLGGRVVTRVDATIAVSRHTQSLVLELGAQPDSVHIVHPGVDPPPVEKASIRNGDRAIVVVARLNERYKGHDVLLRALPLIRSRVPDAHLDVVGDGVLRGQLESLAGGLGMSEAVTFHGWVSDEERNAIMRRASVFAMLSRIDALGSGEGFGIVYVEAGALGLPVVAGNVAGALDAVVDGQTGILVDPNDHVAAGDAVAALLLESELAQRMGAAGREHASSFSWQRAAAGVEDILDGVIDR